MLISPRSKELQRILMKKMSFYFSRKFPLYRNNLKNREFVEEVPQNLCSERGTIAPTQGASENKNSEAKPTQSKTDSSSYFGISSLLIIIQQSERSQFSTCRSIICVENGPDPKIFSNLDKHRCVFDIDYLLGVCLGDV